MIYAIFILCLILFAIAIYALRKLSKQYKTLQEIYYLQKLMLSHSQFTNDANEMILWKIRYDIWCWNENLVKAENYEMAQQAKVATNIIADMITFYRNNLKQIIMIHTLKMRWNECGISLTIKRLSQMILFK